MKKGTFFRKAALTAAICFTISQSVWAMPSGGVVVDGSAVSIDAGDIANPASGATITVTSYGTPSIINWNTFSIAKGETLNFDTTCSPLLNRVTGEGVSEIYGNLNQISASGSYGVFPLFLVNPNGILVAPGATINAKNLVLSTLEITDENFMDPYGASAMGYTFKTPSGKTAAAPVIIKNAKININGKYFDVDYSPQASFKTLGGTVEIADGVSFAVGETSTLELAAGQTATMFPSSDLIIAANGKNTVSFNDSKSSGAKLSELYIKGGTVNLSNAELQGNDVRIWAYSSKNEVSDNTHNEFSMSASTDNAIKVNHVNIVADDTLSIVGGKVDIVDSTISYTAKEELGDEYLQMNIAALSSISETATWDSAPDGGSVNHYQNTYVLGDASHSVTVANTTLDSQNNIWILGGQVTLDGVNAKGKNNVVVTAVHDATNTYDMTYNIHYDEATQQYETTETSTPRVWTGNAAADNTVTVSGGSNIDAGKTAVVAGSNVTVTEQSTVSAGKNIFVKAGASGTMTESGYSEVRKPGDDRFSLYEARRQITDVTITGTPGEIKVSTDSKLLKNGVDVTDQYATNRPVSSTISPIIPPEDAAEVASGRTVMNAIFAKATSAEEIQELTRKLVQSINDEFAATDRAKTAKTAGVILAIWENTKLNETEKKALEQEVIQTFTPTQVALSIFLNNLNN